MSNENATPDPRCAATALRAWFAANRRRLPWRAGRDPWRVLVSETMLQQTQVATVIPHFERFVARYPDPASFAAAGEDEVLAAWRGLGYYRRARLLAAAARAVVERHGGRFPADVAGLRALPGVGPYTAGALAALAFGLPEPAVDGNVLRVLARFLLVATDVARPPARRAIEAYARALVESGQPGELVEALMELGALVCVPGAPRCGRCPLADECRGRAAGRERALPVKAAAKPRPVVPVEVALARAPDGRLLVERRPASGILARQWQLPQAEGDGRHPPDLAAHLARLGAAGHPGPALARLEHVFTHRVWSMTLVPVRLLRPPAEGETLRLVAAERLGDLPLSTPHRKLLALVPPPPDGAVRRLDPA